MKAYKLLDQELKSHHGTFQWEIGKEYTIDKPGNEMCSDEVFHCYNHPLLAALFNPIHISIDNPRLFEIEVPEFVNDDKLKYASKRQKLIKEITLPVISNEQRVEFAIRVTKLVCDDEAWNAWADRWLSGEDRSVESACAARVANDSYRVANAAAAWNAAAAAESDSDDSAAWAASWAADSARVANDDFIRIIEEILDKKP